MGCVRGNKRGHGIAAAVKPLMAGVVGAWLLSSTPALLADTNWVGPDGGSWFQDASPNDWSLTGGLVNSGAGNPAIGNGAGVIDTSAGGVGVIYDPVNDPLNPNPSVTNYSYTQLYMIHGATAATPSEQQSSKLTIKSGTLTVPSSGKVIIGRYGNDNISGSGAAITPTGYVFVNGGTLAVQSADLDVANNGGTITTGDVNASGTLDFDSGSIITNVLRTGVSTSAGGVSTGTFINNGQGLGTISLTGFQPGAGATGNGALEIHDGANGVTLINVAGPTKIGDVATGVDQATSSTFNFVLNAAPAMTLNLDPSLTDLVPANVDLINSTAISGYFTSVEGISGLTGETPMPTVTTSFGGNSYTWSLDYTAVVLRRRRHRDHRRLRRGAPRPGFDNRGPRARIPGSPRPSEAWRCSSVAERPNPVAPDRLDSSAPHQMVSAGTCFRRSFFMPWEMNSPAAPAPR